MRAQRAAGQEKCKQRKTKETKKRPVNYGLPGSTLEAATMLGLNSEVLATARMLDDAPPTQRVQILKSTSVVPQSASPIFARLNVGPASGKTG